jgi:hypothetical protein
MVSIKYWHVLLVKTTYSGIYNVLKNEIMMIMIMISEDLASSEMIAEIFKSTFYYYWL